jgi:peptidoglycan/xylan/chitin deacetylase (PgdA/CDA1 family)
MADELVHLCFHGIGRPQRELEPGEDRYWVDEGTYLAILDDVVARPEVRISFDDGNASDLEIGLPGLRERDLTATFFVLAGRLGSPGSLGADGVRELQDHGMTIGSHGMSHRPWPGMDDAAAQVELVDARARLEEVAGRPVEVAALPLGRYDRRVLGRLRRLGYRTVHTSDRRRARAGAWLQPRFSVRAGDTVESLRAEVFAPEGRLARARAEATGLVKRWR